MVVRLFMHISASSLLNFFKINNIRASGAVYRDTRGGLLARRVGVQVLQFVKDIQEKYNQFVIFYRTGKLAYMTSKVWEQYDETYGIQSKVDEFKRLAMNRAISFNTAFQEYHITDQVDDIWKSLMSAPTSAQKLDDEYAITSSITSFTKNFYNSITEGVSSLMDSDNYFRKKSDEEESNTLISGFKKLFSNKALKRAKENASKNDISRFFNVFRFFGGRKNSHKRKTKKSWHYPNNDFRQEGKKLFSPFKSNRSHKQDKNIIQRLTNLLSGAG